MKQLKRLENIIAKERRENLKKDLLIGILTDHLTIEVAKEVLTENNYLLRSSAIDMGLMMSNEQADQYKEMLKNKENDSTSKEP